MILAVLIGRLGTGPFLSGVRTTNAWALGAAVVVTAFTTLCCAWRWGVVSQALGADVPLRDAFLAYYRSQFLNATLPGGVLGDLHRAVRHGRRIGDLGASVRSVVWERSLGQAVQILLTVVLLLVLPSPLRSPLLALVAVGVAGPLVVVLATRVLGGDLHRILGTRGARVAVVTSSTVAAAGHVALFLVAMRVTGVDAPTGRLLPLALVVLLASAVPTNIAGWGPREGMAAWAFSSAGLTADQGVASAVLYGVMVLVATLPGALVLVAGRHRREAPRETTGSPVRRLVEAAHG